MYNQQHHLKSNNISKLGVLALSIVLLTGISLVPTLQIGVQGQVQQQLAPERPLSPGGSPSSGSTSPSPPLAPERPLSPGGSPSSGSTSPSPTTRPALDTADGGAANQTGGGGAANQTAMVMIPQSSVMMIINNVQIAMGAVGDDEDAMMALESVNQELRSAATAAGMSLENITDSRGGDTE
jgi:hypothetical protein